MPAPLLTLVVPVYNVSAFLPDFLDSLAAQRPRPTAADVEVVFVDDGSTDRSAELIQEWCATTSFPTRLVQQANAGLAGARNTGLAEARGTWVSFPDPDDVLAAGYLTAVRTHLLGLADDVTLAAARILMLRPDGMVSDTHPLHAKFAAGSQLVDLDRQPEFIQLQAASACYRRALVLGAGLVFDPVVRPNFEDAFFTAHYLALTSSRMVALMADAHYVYRRRDDGSSLVQQSWSSDAKYTVLPEVGYLRLLRDFTPADGHAPRWVQNLVLYDLLYYFRQEQRIHGATAAVPAAVGAIFHDLVGQILALVEDEMLLAFDVVETPVLLRTVLLIGYKHPRTVPEQVHVRRVDAARQIVQVRYLYGEHEPVAAFAAEGVPAAPLHTKIRDHTYFGRTLAHERIAWLPATGSLGLTLDGRQVPLVLGPPTVPLLTARPAQLWSELAGRAVPTLAPPTPTSTGPAVPRARPSASARALAWARRSPAGRVVRRSRTGTPETALPGETEQQTSDRLLKERARSPETRQRFRHAWAFLDRDTMAQDNAEHLYRWVREHRPEVNAWFVLSPASPDWPRLAAEGFRLVDPAGDDYVLLMLNTEHRISSQVDHYVVVPLDPERFGSPRGRFTFLQHGVTKDDLSRWLDRKRLSLLVTSTPDEQRGIAGDHTPYLFTSKEVRLLGMPRHDRLLALATNRTSAPRWLLLAPTWRRDLVGETVVGNERVARAELAGTPYLRAWLEVMASPELQAYATAAGLRMAFLPHPNLDPHLGDVLPPHVTRLTYAGADVQEVLVDTALMITDYSSLAFEQAYLGRPVVYYQHDGGAIFAGSHIGRRGSWSYAEQGFGPVASDLDALVAGVRAVTPTPEGLVAPAVYRERVAATFPFRDGGCCERVYDAVVDLTRPAPEAAALLRPPASPPAPLAPYAHRSKLLGTGK